MQTIEQIKADIAKTQNRLLKELAEGLSDYITDDEVKRVNEVTNILINFKDIPLDRLEQICNAERDGRCVVLPVNVGDTVYGYPYCWSDGTIAELGICEWKVACIHYSVNKAGEIKATVRATIWKPGRAKPYAYITEDIPFGDFGKTVFLTESEAQAKLESEGKK